MKKIALLLFPVVIAIFCIAAAARAPRKQKIYTVKGTVWNVQDYCGGAVPADGMSSHTTPAARTKIYVRKAGTTSIIDSVTTDTLGAFSIKLRPGPYEFVESWKAKPLVMPRNSTYEQWDTLCYRSRYQKPDVALNVFKNVSDVKITLNHYCAWKQPCCTYSGPLPPANRGGYQPGHQE